MSSSWRKNWNCTYTINANRKAKVAYPAIKRFVSHMIQVTSLQKLLESHVMMRSRGFQNTGSEALPICVACSSTQYAQGEVTSLLMDWWFSQKYYTILASHQFIVIVKGFLRSYWVEFCLGRFSRSRLESGQTAELVLTVQSNLLSRFPKKAFHCWWWTVMIWSRRRINPCKSQIYCVHQKISCENNS